MDRQYTLGYPRRDCGKIHPDFSSADFGAFWRMTVVGVDTESTNDKVEDV